MRPTDHSFTFLQKQMNVVKVKENPMTLTQRAKPNGPKVLRLPSLIKAQQIEDDLRDRP